MSLFTYISFPRQVDKSCLISKIDKSKIFTVFEIRGTELEKQLDYSLDGLPDELGVYLGDEDDFQGTEICDNEEASFINVFNNRFIYCLEAEFKLIDAEKHITDYMSFFSEYIADNGDASESEYMEYLHNSVKRDKDNVALCRKQLKELVLLNIQPNEMVEMYSEWISENISVMGPPQETVILETSEILTSDLLRNENKRKIEIQHTVS